MSQFIGKRTEGPAEGQPVPLNDSKTRSSSDDKACREENLFVLSGRGVYVSGLINHTRVSLLLDTGATSSILNEETWKKSGQYRPEKLHKFNASLTVANGEKLAVQGKTVINVRFGNSLFRVPMLVVRDIPHACILGSDFFERESCQILYDVGTLVVQGEEIPIFYERKAPSVCRVVVDEEVELKAGTEVVLCGKLEPGFERNNGTPGILEGHRKNTAEKLTSRFCIARSLTVPKEGKTPIRMANFSDQTMLLRPGQTVAQFYPLDRVDASVNLFDLEEKPSERETKQNPRVEMPPSDPPVVKQEIRADLSGLSEGEKQSFNGLLEEYRDLFAMGDGNLGRTDLLEHTIDTGSATPVKQAPRRLPPFKRDEVDRQLSDLLAQGRIEPSNSPWSSPIVLAKKHDGSYRLCIDYRKLNSVTVKDAQPLPRSDDILESLGGAKWFSCLDLASGYWQVPVAKRDRPKTAFVTHRGQFQWTCLPFGVTNGPGTFTRLMNLALQGLTWKECLVYLDDIIIMSGTFEEHLSRLRSVFERLREAGLKLKSSKCIFLQRQVSFLGHVVSAEGIQTDPNKVAAVRDWPTPTSISELKGFLGLVTYYRRFIPSFSAIAEPLNYLTRKGVEFKWGPQQEKAFCELKHHLMNPPVLAYPDFSETSGQFILDTDASSGHGIGAVLSQIQSDGTERVLAYGSRALHCHERNYCATRLEMLALVDFIDHFRYYLLGRKFLVRTDHHALKWLMSFKQPEGQVARWLERLQEYDFTVEHRPGISHANADALSRRPRRKHGSCPSCGDTEYVSAAFLRQSKEKEGTSETPERTFSWATAEIAQAQRSDPDISPVIARMEEGQPKPSPGELLRFSPISRAIWAQHELLELKDNVLRIRPKEESTNLKPRIVLPEPLVKPALQRLHDGVEGSHLGQLKTLRKVQARFWRPGLAKTVKDYCAACLTCAACKPPRKTPKAPLRPIPSSYPFQRLHIDIIGPLPRTKRGNRYILTVQCSFTKWVEAYAIPNQRAKTCARVLVDNWVYRYGAPDTIHSDQGRNFESHLFSELCQMLEIRKTRTTPYHPAGNGQVENANKSIKGLLMAKVESDPETWDQHLGPCMMAYRSSEHISTGYTPFTLMFGREMRLPLDVMVGNPDDAAPDRYGEYVSKLKNQLSDAFQDVRQHLKTAQQRQKEYFDRGVKERLYQPGDQVFLFDPQLKPGEAAKFHRKWKGPYEVLARTTEVNYRIKRPHDPVSRSKVVHFDNLKLYQRRQPEVQVSQKNQSGCERGNKEKERGTVLKSLERRGTNCGDDLSEDRDEDELPDFCLPIPEPVVTGQQAIQDPEYNGSRKVDVSTANEVGNLDGTHQSDDHQPEGISPPGSQVGDVDPGLSAQANPGAEGDVEESTTYTRQENGLESTLVADGNVGQAEERVGRPDPTAQRPPPAASRPKRVTRPPDRYGDWELNTVCSSGYPMAPKNKVEGLRAFFQEQKNRVLRFKSDYVQKVRQLRIKDILKH